MISVSSLTKYFTRSRAALDAVSFEVKPAEVMGLLGHNGAGKSTVLGIILGMVRPDGGEVKVAGHSVQRERALALRKIGAIFEAPAFYEYMSGWQNLRTLCALSGWWEEPEVKRVLEIVGLTRPIHFKVRTYSHGMRQRLALAQALLPEPRVLLLDEPTDGLDPEGIKWFREFVLRLREERGMTILFNSHLLSEVEQMCDRVAIIRQGELVYDGDLEGIADERLTLRIDAEPAQRAAEVLRALGAEEGRERRVLFPAGTDPSAVSRALVEAGVNLREMSRVRRSLEDVYLEVSGIGMGGADEEGGLE
jgi:ABC-2 type transport system ATP-binding protein